MKVGDLVRLVNEWRGHNPWMKFPDDNPKIGLIVGIISTKSPYRVLIGAREVLIPPHRLVSLKKR